MSRTTSLPALAVVAISAVLASGCTLLTGFDQYSNRDRTDSASMDGGGVDGGGGDGGPSHPDTGLDAGPIDAAGIDAHVADHDASTDAGTPGDSGVCPAGCPTGQVCCNGTCADTMNDPAHCGATCTACASGPNAVASCSAGVCSIACTSSHFDDCDHVASTGCERDLTTSTDCGACDAPCTSPMACVVAGASATCASSCTAPRMMCGTSCTDTSTSDMHCGSCTHACPTPPGTMATCAASMCSLACAGGALDCDHDLASPTSNGCEGSSSAVWFRDMDGDGFGDSASTIMGCPMTGYVSQGTDCNDASASISPVATERCNGIDDDCDSVADEGFNFGGVPLGGVCHCVSGAASGVVQCDGAGTAATCHANEVCNGYDDDCDGTADNGFSCVARSTQTCTVVSGTCSAVGTQTCSGVTCTLGACTPPAEVCDGTDQNCDGFVDEGALTIGPRRTVWSAGEYDSFDVAWNGTSGAMALGFFDGTSTALYLQPFDGGGVAVGSPVMVDSTMVLQGVAGIGWDGASWVVVWARGPGDGTATTYLRTVSTTGVLGAITMIGSTANIGVVSGVNGAGIVFTSADNFTLLGGIYSHGAWARAPSAIVTITTGYFQSYLDIASAGGSNYAVVASNWSQGVAYTQTFGMTTTGTQRAILGDTNAEYPIHLDVDRVSGNLVVAWQEASETPPHWYAQPFVAATGAAVGTAVLLPGMYILEPRPVATATEVFVAPYARMRASDGVLYPENYGIMLGNLGGALATPGGTQRYLTFQGYNPDSANDSQAVSCP